MRKKHPLLHLISIICIYFKRFGKYTLYALKQSFLLLKLCGNRLQDIGNKLLVIDHQILVTDYGFFNFLPLLCGNRLLVVKIQKCSC